MLCSYILSQLNDWAWSLPELPWRGSYMSRRLFDRSNARILEEKCLYWSIPVVSVSTGMLRDDCTKLQSYWRLLNRLPRNPVFKMHTWLFKNWRFWMQWMSWLCNFSRKADFLHFRIDHLSHYIGEISFTKCSWQIKLPKHLLQDFHESRAALNDGFYHIDWMVRGTS